MTIGIFQFGFGQSGAGAGAPMHGFEASVDVSFEDHGPENLDLGGFVGLLKGQVGMLPVGPDPPAAKPSHLAVHLFEGIGRRFLAQFDRRQPLPLLLGEGLQHLEFDR